ncbi:RNA polymerase sigma factor RpoD/SigA [Psychromonas sp. SP041]|uniref:sigma-70 family RNA polymerase sigma factor n=1 Tax=Psychromonas sp. SP041 TaxID=1365007 RepID=UPI0004239A12|nr:RNA polymerase sigma factor RpoD/SigA [Psychromonas sp. SP041]
MNKVASISSLTHYINSVKDIPLLTHNEVIELSKDYLHNESLLSKNKLIKHNLRLVISLAKKYETNDSAMIMDLIQEGNEGLMTAVEKYDYEMGYKLSTYASNWIRYRIELHLNKNRKIVSVPVHTMKLLNKVAKEVSLMRGTDALITPESVAKKVGMADEVSKISAVMDLMQWEHSLNHKPNDDEDGDEMINLIKGESSMESDVEDREASNWISVALEELSPKHKEIICMLYGLHGYPEQNRSQIATVFGLSRERIRQIANVATDKLQKFASRKGIEFSQLI